MKNPRSPWLLAAATATGVAIAEVATIIHLIPGTAIVDTGALLLTGFFAGLFLGFHIAHQKAMSTDQPGRPS